MATDPIIDLAQRLSRELSQESEKLSKERERFEKALDEERRGLKEELRQREQHIQEERDGLGYDQERVDIITGRNQIDDDVLSLNVGGEFFFTQRSTLCTVEDSYLANLFSGRWESSIERDSFGRFFLDFDPHCFGLLLNYLRSKRQSRLPLPAPQVPSDKEEQFWNLVEYFGLTEQFEAPEIQEPKAEPGPSGLFGTVGSAVGTVGTGLFQTALGVLRGDTREAASPAAAPVLPAPTTQPAFHSVATVAAAATAAPVLPDSTHAHATTYTSYPGPGPMGPASVPATASGSSVPGHSEPQPSQVEAATSASSASSASTKKPGWSKRVAHRLAVIQDSTVRINDSRSSGAAAALRASRGFRAGQHAWEVTVLLCSDWSYVGFVSDDWTSLTLPIGRAPESWGIASNGRVYAAGTEQSEVVQDYENNSSLSFVVDMDRRTASVIIDGHEFQVFRHLPSTVFPAVSNCRSPAVYQIEFLGELTAEKQCSATYFSKFPSLHSMAPLMSSSLRCFPVQFTLCTL